MPDYLESEWCLAEWKAMEKLEQQRLGKERELILPILLQGDRKQIEDFVGTKIYMDLSKVVDPAQELNTTEYRREIKKLAELIDERVKKLDDAEVDCSDFSIDVPEAEDYEDPEVFD